MRTGEPTSGSPKKTTERGLMLCIGLTWTKVPNRLPVLDTGAGHVMMGERHVPAGAGMGCAACGAGRRQPRAVCLKAGVAHGYQQAPQCCRAGHALSAGPAAGSVIPACKPTLQPFTRGL